MIKTLIVPIIAGAQSSGFWVEDGHMVTLVLYSAVALEVAKFADVQISPDNTTWQDVFVDGAQKRLNSTNNVVTVVGPGFFRVDKEATTAAVGVYAAMRG